MSKVAIFRIPLGAFILFKPFARYPALNPITLPKIFSFKSTEDVISLNEFLIMFNGVNCLQVV
jgi:hypothetical protein